MFENTTRGSNGVRSDTTSRHGDPEISHDPYLVIGRRCKGLVVSARVRSLSSQRNDSFSIPPGSSFKSHPTPSPSDVISMIQA